MKRLLIAYALVIGVCLLPLAVNRPKVVADPLPATPAPPALTAGNEVSHVIEPAPLPPPPPPDPLGLPVYVEHYGPPLTPWDELYQKARVSKAWIFLGLLNQEDVWAKDPTFSMLADDDVPVLSIGDRIEIIDPQGAALMIVNFFLSKGAEVDVSPTTSLMVDADLDYTGVTVPRGLLVRVIRVEVGPIHDTGLRPVWALVTRAYYSF